MPPSQTGSVCFTVGNDLYYGTGANEYDLASPVFSSNFFRFDLTNGKWYTAPGISNGFPPRVSASCVTYNNMGYVGFGRDANAEFNDLWQIDPSSGVLTQMASIPVGRFNAIAFTCGSKLYAGGGINNVNQLSDFYKYDFNTNTWASEGTLPSVVTPSNSYILKIDGKGYMMNYNDSLGNKVRSFSMYDTTSHLWIPRADYPGIAVSNVAGFGFNDQGFLGFGYDSTATALTEFFQYDALNDAWLQKNPYDKITQYGYIGFSNGTKAGLAGTNGHLFQYDIVSDTWQETVGIPYLVTASRMVVIHNTAYGKNCYYNITNDYWTLDPQFNIEWVFQLNDIAYGLYNGIFSFYDPSLPVIPFLQASPPPNGMRTFFSIGNKGYAGDFYQTKNFWEFDPASGQWSRKSDFPGVARECNGGFSIGPKGYITGGWCDSIGWYINDFWEYDPQTDSWSQKANGPTGYLGSFMEGDATRGYVGCGITDAVGTDVGDVSVYNPATDSWSSIPGFTPRHNQYSFIANDNLYVGGGSTRLSQLDHEMHADFYRLPLAGINGEITHNYITENVFPNPSSGNFFVDSKTTDHVTIFDEFGRVVYSNALRQGKNLLRLKGVLNPGNYFITFDSGNAGKLLILPE